MPGSSSLPGGSRAVRMSGTVAPDLPSSVGRGMVVWLERRAGASSCTAAALVQQAPRFFTEILCFCGAEQVELLVGEAARPPLGTAPTVTVFRASRHLSPSSCQQR